MALLDTTVFVDLGGRAGKKRAAAAEDILRQLLAAGETLMTSRVNLAELFAGAELSDDPAAEHARIANHLGWVAMLELDDAAAMEFGRLRAALQRPGRLVGDMDILIGAIALANGQAVVTRNAAHFVEMRGLKVIGYGA